ncbi:Hypothetical protein GLP15_4707 [Giardia lamblia P15]|uniref:Coiled-coil protein n=1 Tax=Giardia intestinalis (strain P15) TaxID=658858 RepID=E1F1Q1_GIAIA|nr:Hypothetical protein GLP15_4707 [Giardia lamblia P15]
MQAPSQALPSILPQERTPLDNGSVYKLLAKLVAKRLTSDDLSTTTLLERVQGLRARTDSYESMLEARNLLLQLVTRSDFRDVSLVGSENQNHLPRWTFALYQYQEVDDSASTALLSGTAILSSELTNVLYSLGCISASEASRADKTMQIKLYARAGHFFDEASNMASGQTGPMTKAYLSGLAEMVRGLGYEAQSQTELQDNLGVMHAFAKAALSYKVAVTHLDTVLRNMVDPSHYPFMLSEANLVSIKERYYSATTRYYLSKVQAQICVYSTAREAAEAQKILVQLKTNLERGRAEYQEEFDVSIVEAAVRELLSCVNDQTTMFSDCGSAAPISLESLSLCLRCDGRAQVHDDAFSHGACASSLSSGDQLLEINALTDKLITYEHELNKKTIELEELKSGRAITDSSIFTTEISRLETLVDEQGAEIERLRDYIAERDIESVRMLPIQPPTSVSLAVDMDKILREKDSEISRLQKLLYNYQASPAQSTFVRTQMLSLDGSEELRKLLDNASLEAFQNKARADTLEKELQELRNRYAEITMQPKAVFHDATLDASVYTSEIERLEMQLEEQGGEIERLRDYITENEVGMKSFKLLTATQQAPMTTLDISALLLGKDAEISRLQQVVYGLASKQGLVSTDEVSRLRSELATKTLELQNAYSRSAVRSDTTGIDTSIYTIEIDRLENLISEQGEEIERLRNYIADMAIETQRIQPVAIDLLDDSPDRLPTPPARPYDTWMSDDVEVLPRARIEAVTFDFIDVPVVERLPTPIDCDMFSLESPAYQSHMYVSITECDELRRVIAEKDEIINELQVLLEQYKDMPVPTVHIQRTYGQADIPIVERVDTPQELPSDTWVGDIERGFRTIRRSDIPELEMVEIPKVERINTPLELPYDTWMSDDVCSQVQVRVADVSMYGLAEVSRVERIDTPSELSSDTWMVSGFVPVPVPVLSTEVVMSCEQMPAVDSYEVERLEKEVEELRAQLFECEQELKRKDDEIRRLTDDLAAEKRNIKKVEIIKEVPVYSPPVSPSGSGSDLERLKSSHRHEIATLNNQIEALKEQLNSAGALKPQVVTEYKFSDIDYDKLLAEKDEENDRLRTMLSIQARLRATENRSSDYEKKAKEAAEAAEYSMRIMEEKLAAANAAAERAFRAAPQNAQIESLQKKLKEKENVIAGLLQAMTEQKDSFASLHRAHALQEEKYSNLCSILNEQEETIRSLMRSPAGTNNLTLSTSLRGSEKAGTGQFQDIGHGSDLFRSSAGDSSQYLIS